MSGSVLPAASLSVARTVKVPSQYAGVLVLLHWVAAQDDLGFHFRTALHGIHDQTSFWTPTGESQGVGEVGGGISGHTKNILPLCSFVSTFSHVAWSSRQG